MDCIVHSLSTRFGVTSASDLSALIPQAILDAGATHNDAMKAFHDYLEARVRAPTNRHGRPRRPTTDEKLYAGNIVMGALKSLQAYNAFVHELAGAETRAHNLVTFTFRTTQPELWHFLSCLHAAMPGLLTPEQEIMVHNVNFRIWKPH